MVVPTIALVSLLPEPPDDLVNEVIAMLPAVVIGLITMLILYKQCFNVECAAHRSSIKKLLTFRKTRLQS